MAANSQLLRDKGGQMWTILLGSVTETDVSIMDLLAGQLTPKVAARLQHSGDAEGT